MEKFKVFFASNSKGQITSAPELNPEHVQFSGSDDMVQSAEVVLGDHTGAFNFRQLENGRYVGASEQGHFTTLMDYKRGESPERFKNTLFTTSTPEQVEEYRGKA